MYDAKAKLKSKTVNIVAGKYVFQELHTLVHFAREEGGHDEGSYKVLQVKLAVMMMMIIIIIIIIIIIEGSKDLSVKVDYG